MKAAVFGQRGEGKIHKIVKMAREEKFEWFMFKAFLICFFALIAAQTVLLNPSVRSSALEHYYIEGEPLKEEAYLFVPCKMELHLINTDSCADLKVLVNGEEKAAFEGDTVLLELKNGDVVELDASSVLVLATVQVSAVSENIKSILGKTITVSDGITLVTRVQTVH